MTDHAKNRAAARAVLDPLFVRHGFRVEDGAAGRGSSGAFAMWSYDKPGRHAQFETRDRFALLAAYEDTEHGVRVGHEEYVGALSRGEARRLPDSDPVAHAVEVRDHLEAYGSDFLDGDAAVLREVARERDAQPGGFAAIVAAEERIRRSRDADR